MKRILALICVLACLCGFALPALANPDVITVTAEVPADWTNVHVYVWVDDTNNLLAWPGTPMNKAADGRYTLEIPSGYPYIIINNGEGAAQTQDMSMDGMSDVWVTVAGTYGEVLYYDPGVGNIGTGEPSEPTELTSMALVGEGDDELAWEPGNTNYNMTIVEPGVYTKDISLYKGDTIKFKLCGNGDWGNGHNYGIAEAGAITAGTAVELVQGDGSQDISYTATQDCKLTVTFDGNGDVPTVTVEETAASLEPKPEKTMVKVYVSVAGDYTPNLWAWGDTANAFASWPGEAMTKEGDWWVIEIPDDCHSAIVNDGNSQTIDLSITMGADNWIVVDESFAATVSASKPDGTGKPSGGTTTGPDATEPETTDPAKKDEEKKDDKKDDKKDEGGVNVFMIIAIALVVVMVGTVVATVIILKKKKG